MVLIKYIHCYAAGLHFTHKQFCLSILSAILEFFNTLKKVPHPKEIQAIYSMSKGCYGLRKLVLKIWIQRSHLGLRYLTEQWDDIPEQFLHDLQDSKDQFPFLYWYQPRVDLALELNEIQPDLMAALDRDLEEAIAAAAEEIEDIPEYSESIKIENLSSF
ncbi:hypothetical protein OPT61_g7959 [Boeremia exigua]|uniref:Uncharacterized protein n=1 Tax=Boeremia exigua TaxID=749465 RepID=A0ACC2I0L1_9PLEO|nr:hypothetical protein OPT61_g7959 [Boeremia exigua]